LTKLIISDIFKLSKTTTFQTGVIPMNEIQAFFERFLKQTKKSAKTKYKNAFHFELTEPLANSLLELVLSGQKKATASSYYSYILDQEPLPEVGDLSIVTNFKGEPKCVIETTKVTMMPYKDLTFEIVKREGEDDSLASWRKGHQRFYEEEGKLMGYTFHENMLVVFEDFQVIYQENS